VLATLWVGPLLVPLVTQATGWHPGPPVLATLLVQALLDTRGPTRDS
jgi:hypothetical protein